MKLLIIFIFYEGILGDCKCGGPYPNKKIVKGHVVMSHSIPYQVGLISKKVAGKKIFCGGSLISPNYVVTAAHCTFMITMMNKDPNEITVVVGEHNQNINGEGEEYILVESITEGPGFSLFTGEFENDISLLKLQKAVGVSNKAGIVCLSPSKLQSLEGIPIKVSGWGQTSDSKGSTSPVLLATELIGSNMKECKQIYGKPDKKLGIPAIQLNSTAQFCANRPKTVTGMCHGDSGGPMTTLMNGKVILVGVVSIARKYCEISGSPGVGTMISTHRQWILENSDVQKYQCFK